MRTLYLLVIICVGIISILFFILKYNLLFKYKIKYQPNNNYFDLTYKGIVLRFNPLNSLCKKDDNQLNHIFISITPQFKDKLLTLSLSRIYKFNTKDRKNNTTQSYNIKVNGTTEISIENYSPQCEEFWYGIQVQNISNVIQQEKGFQLVFNSNCNVAINANGNFYSTAYKPEWQMLFFKFKTGVFKLSINISATCGQ